MFERLKGATDSALDLNRTEITFNEIPVQASATFEVIDKNQTG